MSHAYSADRHPDEGELADEIAGIAAPAVAEHLAGCGACSERLAALATASISVSRYLRADPEPELPAAVAARFAEAIAAESAARPAVSTRTVSHASSTTPATTTSPDRSAVRSGRRREGWWARHTRLGGVLVTAAALVVVGAGGTVVANLARDGNQTNQAGDARTSATQEDAAAPGNDLGGKATPLGAAAGTIRLHQAAFVDEIGALVSARTRTARNLTSAQGTCANEALAEVDLDDATLTTLSGTFTLDGGPVLVVVAAHDGTRTAVAISGCTSGRPKVAAQGDLH